MRDGKKIGDKIARPRVNFKTLVLTVYLSVFF
nr:MAG TPA: hypothetical protein [Caudoviricetes sp.]